MGREDPILHRRLKSSPVRSACPQSASENLPNPLRRRPRASRANDDRGDRALLAGLLVHVLSARPSPAQMRAKRDRQAIADKFPRLGTI
jgi:hypothetical protein